MDNELILKERITRIQKAVSFAKPDRVLGLDLPSNELWQVVETEIMTQNDYDSILDLVWKAFFKNYLSNRIFNDAKPELLPENQEPVDVIGKCKGHDCGSNREIAGKKI